MQKQQHEMTTTFCEIVRKVIWKMYELWLLCGSIVILKDPPQVGRWRHQEIWCYTKRVCFIHIIRKIMPACLPCLMTDFSVQGFYQSNLWPYRNTTGCSLLGKCFLSGGKVLHPHNGMLTTGQPVSCGETFQQQYNPILTACWATCFLCWQIVLAKQRDAQYWWQQVLNSILQDDTQLL